MDRRAFTASLAHLVFAPNFTKWFKQSPQRIWYHKWYDLKTVSSIYYISMVPITKTMIEDDAYLPFSDPWKIRDLYNNEAY